MSRAQGELRFDTASAISQGGRSCQEDAIISDFTLGSDLSMAVLADGMGGHSAGDLASKTVVTEVFRELTFKRDAIVKGKANVAEVLETAATAANARLSQLVEENPEHKGMGATLLGFLVQHGELSWVSIGDSPLFLFRDNELRQLNEDHSLGPHIDFLLRSGAITEEEAENHPDRNVLTSVLSGETIAHVDCPKSPFALRPGDIIIGASDGLQFLSNDQIASILRDRPLCRSAELAEALMDEVSALNDPEQDNVSLLAIQVRHAPHARKNFRPAAQPAERSRLWSIGASLAKGV